MKTDVYLSLGRAASRGSTKIDASALFLSRGPKIFPFAASKTKASSILWSKADLKRVSNVSEGGPP
jgi:hypothetical protein